MTPKVLILLATFNGARFLREQLDSLRAQTHENWELVVSDDGSTDETLAILESFKTTIANPVVVQQGPLKGVWQNFVSIVRSSTTDAELFAYSDQDDIWSPVKLARAVRWFGTQNPQVPAVYFSRTELIAADGRRIGLSPLYARPPSFRNALVQNIGGGNTMVFNAAAGCVLRAIPFTMPIVSHDWWTYQVITGVGGVAHYDSWPSLKYRQHAKNLVGGNAGLQAKITRLLAFGGGRYMRWNDTNIKYLDAASGGLTEENRKVLHLFAEARRAPATVKLGLLHRSGVYRQHANEQVALYIGALLGRI